MRSIPVLLALSLVGNTPGPSLAAGTRGLHLAGHTPQARHLDVTTYRSWYPPNVTIVDGLFRVDGELLGTGPECQYHVTLSVVDETGTQLVKNEWDGHCPPPTIEGQPAGALETFQFAIVPARYTVRVAVEPLGRPEGRISTETVVNGLAADVLASDLILARRAGWVDSASAAQWSIRKGELGIAAASEVVAQESSPTIAYYLEVYPTAEKPMSGTLYGVILRPDGRQMARLRLQEVDSVVQSKPLAGNVSVEGLAAGEYVLEARLELEDTVLVRAHPFVMEGRVFAQPAASGYFAKLSPADLSRLFDAVAVTLESGTDRDLYARLNADGKRNFLSQYFSGVEPSPGGEAGNPLDQYLSRVEHVNTAFAGRGGEEGWRTDRGRIWMKRGEPNNQVRRPLPPGGSGPYELWQYTTSPGYVYAFVDEARIGSYRLIFSTDPTESTMPDWDRRLATEAVEELIRMGVRPVIR